MIFEQLGRYLDSFFSTPLLSPLFYLQDKYWEIEAALESGVHNTKFIESAEGVRASDIFHYGIALASTVCIILLLRFCNSISALDL
jgi:hypothetical protein